MLRNLKRKYNKFLKNNLVFNSFFGRKLLQSILEGIFFIEGLRRKKLKAEVLKNPARFEIDDDMGFVRCPPFSFDSSEDAMVEAEKIYQNQEDQLKLNHRGKPYLCDISLEGYLTESSPLMKFALDLEVIRTVSAYLGTFPILREVRLKYSPNDSEVITGSQLFHVDKEYPRMMKIFLFISPNTDEDGPLSVLSAKKTEALWNKIGRWKPIHRVTDQQVFDHFSTEDIERIVGEKGSVGFLDVARCLHFGSRPDSNSGPRLVLWCLYSSFCGDKYPFTQLGATRFDFGDNYQNSSISEPIKSLLLL